MKSATTLLLSFAAPVVLLANQQCPAMDAGLLQLPKNMQFAQEKFIKLAERLTGHDICVMEGGYAKKQQMFYLAVSQNGNPKDIKILKYRYEDLDK